MSVTREQAHQLRFRQVHLDFHTHESIEGIGARFEPDRFADTLKWAAIDSINLFARCHHGWLYYDSKAFPERKHPHLTRDLLRDQIDACHAVGIKAPVYVSVQWDLYTAQKYPQWLVRGDYGGMNAGYYHPGFYHTLCVNSGYKDFLHALVRDAFDCVPVDGLWFDILLPQDCNCNACRSEMMAEGIDPSDQAARMAFGVSVMDRFKFEMSNFVRGIDPNVLIFYNAGHVGPSIRQSLAAYTHLELESLPFSWGYTHFPLSVRYARTLGLDYLGMTGKFHTDWGDFHSFKNPAALEFECFSMLAHGGKCCIGDQLPPSGEICEHTYQLIGSVYREVAAREHWCEGARSIAEIGVLTPEAFQQTARHEGVTLDIKGAVHMLQELQLQFDIIDPEADFSAYRLLVLVETIPVNVALSQKLKAFVGNGGKLIANHRAGLGPDGHAFQIDLGVNYQGEDPWEVPFVRPLPGFCEGLPATEHASYHARGSAAPDAIRGTIVTANPSSQVVAEMVAPYFNRTWRHFCSHRHAPSTGQAYAPAVVLTDQTAYISQPIFSLYGDIAPRWARQLLAGVLERLLPDPVVKVYGAPHSLVVTVTRQEALGRTMLHLLNYIPRRNNDKADVVEDVIPIHDVTIRYRCKTQVKSVRTVPEGVRLPYKVEGQYTTFMLPRLGGYQILELT